jgi:hypothetical protein
MCSAAGTYPKSVIQYSAHAIICLKSSTNGQHSYSLLLNRNKAKHLAMDRTNFSISIQNLPWEFNQLKSLGNPLACRKTIFFTVYFNFIRILFKLFLLFSLQNVAHFLSDTIASPRMICQLRQIDGFVDCHILNSPCSEDGYSEVFYGFPRSLLAN